MKINRTKSAIVKFSRRRPDYFTNYQLEGADIPVVQNIKYLGLHLDKLTFNYHVTKLCERTTRLAYAAARLCSSVKKPKLIVKLFDVYIDPIIMYGAVVWAFRTKKMTSLLEHSHRIITRNALNIAPTPLAVNYRPYSQRCQELAIPTLGKRLEYIVLLCLKRLTDSLTFSVNTSKIISAFNAPDPSRRTERRFVDPSVKLQYHLSPIGYALAVVQSRNITFHQWNSTLAEFKAMLKT